jgi:TonB family protein
MAAVYGYRPALTAIFGSTVLAAVCTTASFATEPPVLTQEQAARLAVFAPKPQYPEAARLRRQEGKGVFLLNVNAKTGQVTSIKIEKTTGYQLLDVAALKTLIKWRFKPYSVAKAHVPVTFFLARDSIRTTVIKERFPD